jgi:hypothetical protein
MTAQQRCAHQADSCLRVSSAFRCNLLIKPRGTGEDIDESTTAAFSRISGPYLHLYLYGPPYYQSRKTQNTVVSVGLPDHEDRRNSHFRDLGLVMWYARALTPRLETALDRAQRGLLASFFRIELEEFGRANAMRYPERPTINDYDYEDGINLRVTRIERPLWYENHEFPPDFVLANPPEEEEGRPPGRRTSAARDIDRQLNTPQLIDLTQEDSDQEEPSQDGQEIATSPQSLPSADADRDHGAADIASDSTDGPCHTKEAANGPRLPRSLKFWSRRASTPKTEEAPEPSFDSSWSEDECGVSSQQTAIPYQKYAPTAPWTQMPPTTSIHPSAATGWKPLPRSDSPPPYSMPSKSSSEDDEELIFYTAKDKAPRYGPRGRAEAEQARPERPGHPAPPALHRIDSDSSLDEREQQDGARALPLREKECNETDGNHGEDPPEKQPRIIWRMATAYGLSKGFIKSRRRTEPDKPMHPYASEHEDCARCEAELNEVLRKKEEEEAIMRQESELAMERRNVEIVWHEAWTKLDEQAIYPCPKMTDRVRKPQLETYSINGLTGEKTYYHYRFPVSFLDTIPPSERICQICMSDLSTPQPSLRIDQFRTRQEGQQLQGVFIDDDTDAAPRSQNLEDSEIESFETPAGSPPKEQPHSNEDSWEKVPKGLAQ